MWPPHFENYWMAWKGIAKQGEETGITLGLYFKNSTIVVLSSLLILIIVCTLTGYALARFQFRGRKALFLFFVGMVIMPPHALIVPLYEQLLSLNLINQYLGLILVYIAFSLPFSVVIMRAYFMTFPLELEDAARIDGCSELGIFWKIAFPLSKSSISAIVIVNFTHLWNEMLLSLIVLWQNQKKTLSVGMLGYSGQWGQIEWCFVLAGLSIAAAPTIIFYLIFHRMILRGITLGSIKG